MTSDAERSRAVARAVDTLPDACRQVLVLSHLLGFSRSEVAARVGRPEPVIAVELAVGHRLLVAALMGSQPVLGGQRVAADDVRTAAS